MKLPNFSTLPRHIGIIMDGNGRWATKRKLPRVMGHRKAMRSVREIVETCSELGVEVLTLYAFSTENWKRPPEEVGFLMKLFGEYLEKELETMLKNNIRCQIIGCNNRLPEFLSGSLGAVIRKTKNNTGLQLNLAVDYGGRQEVINACQLIAQKIKEGELKTEDIDEQLISDHLYTAGQPDPDLLIRTSGELRLSNFLLWQSAYAEFYFTDVLWPDFSKVELFKAIESFENRQRRMGGV